MKLLFKLVVNISGYGFCIEPINRSILGIYISEERNMFVAENLLDLSLRNMENIWYILMVEHGIRRHVTFYI